MPRFQSRNSFAVQVHFVPFSFIHYKLFLKHIHITHLISPLSLCSTSFSTANSRPSGHVPTNPRSHRTNRYRLLILRQHHKYHQADEATDKNLPNSSTMLNALVCPCLILEYQFTHHRLLQSQWQTPSNKIPVCRVTIHHNSAPKPRIVPETPKAANILTLPAYHPRNGIWCYGYPCKLRPYKCKCSSSDQESHLPACIESQPLRQYPCHWNSCRNTSWQPEVSNCGTNALACYRIG